MASEKDMHPNHPTLASFLKLSHGAFPSGGHCWPPLVTHPLGVQLGHVALAAQLSLQLAVLGDQLVDLVLLPAQLVAVLPHTPLKTSQPRRHS